MNARLRYASDDPIFAKLTVWLKATEDVSRPVSHRFYLIVMETLQKAFFDPKEEWLQPQRNLIVEEGRQQGKSYSKRFIGDELRRRTIKKCKEIEGIWSLAEDVMKGTDVSADSDKVEDRLEAFLDQSR